VVHLDTPLAEEFPDVAVGQAEAQVPADRQHDHIDRETEAGEGRARDWREARAVSGSHGRSLTAPTVHGQRNKAGQLACRDPRTGPCPSSAPRRDTLDWALAADSTRHARGPLLWRVDAPGDLHPNGVPRDRHHVAFWHGRPRIAGPTAKGGPEIGEMAWALALACRY